MATMVLDALKDIQRIQVNFGTIIMGQSNLFDSIIIAQLLLVILQQNVKVPGNILNFDFWS